MPLTSTERRMMEAAVPASSVDAPVEPPQQTGRKFKVRTKVNRLHNGGWKIVCSHPIPTVEEIMPFLPKRVEAKAKLHFWQGMHIHTMMHTLGTLVKAKEWGEAISRSVMLRYGPDSEGADIEMALNTTAAYISIGNMIYRAQAVDHISTGQKALPALRKRVVDEAREEAERIIKQATTLLDKTRTDTNQMIDQAQARVATIRTKYAHMAIELAAVPPEWLRPNQDMNGRGRGIPIRYAWTFSGLSHSSILSYEVLVRIAFAITEVMYWDKKWAAAPAPAISRDIWVPLSAHNVGKQMSVVGGLLPHMTDTGSCLTIADASGFIESADQLNAFKVSLSRALSQINLGSLLVQPENWAEDLWPFIPEAIKDVLKRGGTDDLHWSAALRSIPGDPQPVEPIQFNAEVQHTYANDVETAPDLVDPEFQPNPVDVVAYDPGND